MRNRKPGDVSFTAMAMEETLGWVTGHRRDPAPFTLPNRAWRLAPRAPARWGAQRSACRLLRLQDGPEPRTLPLPLTVRRLQIWTKQKRRFHTSKSISATFGQTVTPKHAFLSLGKGHINVQVRFLTWTVPLHGGECSSQVRGPGPLINGGYELQNYQQGGWLPLK